MATNIKERSKFLETTATEQHVFKGIQLHPEVKRFLIALGFAASMGGVAAWLGEQGQLVNSEPPITYEPPVSVQEAPDIELP